jgi:hypothetical protein
MWDQLQHLLEELPPLAWNFLLAGTAILSGLIIKWVLSLILYSSQGTRQNLPCSTPLYVGYPGPLGYLFLYLF